MLYAVIILSVVLVISILININLLRKIESNEDYIDDLEKLLDRKED